MKWKGKLEFSSPMTGFSVRPLIPGGKTDLLGGGFVEIKIQGGWTAIAISYKQNLCVI